MENLLGMSAYGSTSYGGYDPQFHEDLRREMKADGIDPDSLSPYFNLASLPAYKRVAGEALRRAHQHMRSEPAERFVYLREPLWKRVARRLGWVKGPRPTITVAELELMRNQMRTAALFYGKPRMVRVRDDSTD